VGFASCKSAGALVLLISAQSNKTDRCQSRRLLRRMSLSPPCERIYFRPSTDTRADFERPLTNQRLVVDPLKSIRRQILLRVICCQDMPKLLIRLGRMRSIATFVYVCLFVSDSARTSQNAHVQTSRIIME